MAAGQQDPNKIGYTPKKKDLTREQLTEYSTKLLEAKNPTPVVRTVKGPTTTASRGQQLARRSLQRRTVLGGTNLNETPTRKKTLLGE